MQNNFEHPFVQPGVKLLEPGKDKVIKVRLLPAFEADQDGAPVAPDSYIPYRYAAEEGKEHGEFSPWIFEVSGYSWMGPNKLQFLSPCSGERTPEDGKDPLIDLFRAARASEDPDIKWFAQKQDRKEDRDLALSWPSKMYLANVLVLTEKNELENQIIRVSMTAKDDLFAKLNCPATRTSPQHPGYENLLFGDVTAPETGVFATMKLAIFGPAKLETSAFHFGKKPNDWQDVEPFAFDPQSEEGQVFLRGRYDLGDTENVVRLGNRDEMVQAIFSGKRWLPYDWAAGVLRDLGYTVPADPHRNTMVSTPSNTPAARPAARPVTTTATTPVATPRSVSPATPRPAAPAAPRPAVPAAAPARPAAPVAARPAPAAPRPAAVPRPTVATKPAVVTTPAAEEEAALAEQGLAPGTPAGDLPAAWDEHCDAELAALEEEIQKDPNNFPTDKMQRINALIMLRDQAAV